MVGTSERNEWDRARYNNSNPDPRFRPSVSALVMKLRGLKQLEEPHAAAHVIDDMIWYRFVHQQSSPTMLWLLLTKLHWYWLHSLRAGGSLEAQDKGQLEWAQFAITRDDEVEKVSLPAETSTSPQIDWEDKELKKRVRQVIFDHSYDPGEKRDIEVPRCSCGREYEFTEQWANHVRSLVWKELQNGKY